MDGLFAPEEMNPAIEGALDRAFDFALSSVEGKRSATVSPIIQIVIRGIVNVISHVQAFPRPEDMLPDCMAAIKAAEGTRAQASGYILVGTGVIVTTETIDTQQDELSVVGVGVDRNSWGKALVAGFDTDENGGLIAIDREEYVEHGLFAGTVFDPWHVEL